MSVEADATATIDHCRSIIPMDRGRESFESQSSEVPEWPTEMAENASSDEVASRSTGGAAMTFHVRNHTNEAELAAIAEPWNDLAGDIPFRRFDWLAPWWRHYHRPMASLFVLSVEDQSGRIRGLAPWYLESTPGQGRVIQFLGSGEVCSDYMSILAQPGFEQSVAAALCDWLCGEAAEEWDLIQLLGVESGDLNVGLLANQFSARDYHVHRQPGMDCWRLALAPTWEDFVSGLHSSRRAKIRQALRKHFDNGQAVVRLLTDPAELDRRFDMLVDLHQRRRHELGQPGCFASAEFADFHRDISRRFYAAGKLRLLWTELAGRPIAAEYSLTGGDTVYYYQTGIEPEAVKVGPGWLGMIGSLQQAIQTGYRTFDFLRGDEAYKTSWGAQRHKMMGTRIVARRASARLRHAVWLARRRVRGLMKHGFHFGRRIVNETD
jgi:CelD/BcsL family acetyltransferase involved in cellulose biosynthesis